jgi:hypothetical protein
MKRVIQLLACLVLPVTVAAQSDCVTLPKPDGVLRSVARYFLDDDLQPVREGWLAKVDSAAPRVVLSNAQTCKRIMRAVTSVMRKAGTWQAFQSSGYEFAVFQIGIYYAVVIEQLDPPGETRLGRVPMLVFRTADLGYVGTIGV